MPWGKGKEIAQHTDDEGNGYVTSDIHKSSPPKGYSQRQFESEQNLRGAYERGAWVYTDEKGPLIIEPADLARMQAAEQPQYHWSKDDEGNWVWTTMDAANWFPE